MTTKNYSYYTFPRTPDRTTPSPVFPYRSSSSRNQQKQNIVPSGPRTPSRQIQRNWDENSESNDNDYSDMASSPASTAKSQGLPAQQTPKTPTKAPRSSVANTPQQKLGQQTGTKSTPSAQQSVTKNAPSAPGAGSKPNTPRTGAAKKPIPSGKFSGKAQNLPGKAQDSPAGKAQNSKPVQQAKSTAEETSKQPDKATEQASNQATEGANPADGLDGLTSQSSEAEAPDALGKLKKAAPEPIQDDDDDKNDAGDDDDNVADGDDAAESVTTQIKDTADDANDQANGLAGDATEKAGQLGDKASDLNPADTNGLDDSQQPLEQAQKGQDQQQPPQQQQKSNRGGLLKGAQGLANKASGIAGKFTGGAADKAKKAPQDPTGAAGDTVNDAKDAGGELADGAQDAVSGAQEDASQGVEKAQGVAGDVADQARDTVNDASDQAQDTVNDASDQAQGTVNERKDSATDTTESGVDAAQNLTKGLQDGVDGANDTAEGVANDAQETAQDATGAELPKPDNITKQLPQPPEGLPLDFSILNGLEVQGDGTVFDNEGNAIGKLAEGDAEDLEGYPIGDDGEILDDDGDLVGRVELLPDEIKKQINAAREQGTELPEGADEYLSKLDEIKDTAEDAAEEAVDEGPQLPGLNILDGLTCQIDGLVYDNEGNTVGKVVDGDPEQLQNATLNEQGEFLNEEGNVIGNAEIHEDAAELVQQGIYDAAGDIADGPQLPGLDILNGLTCQIDGLVYDNDGNTIGKVVDGDPEQLQNATLNDKGEFVDEEGNVVGNAEIHEDAAELVEQGVYDAAGAVDDAVDETQDQAAGVEVQAQDAVEQVGDAADEAAEGIEDQLPGIEALEGYDLNESGDILDEGGNLLGTVENEELKQKLADGELDPADLNINDAGEVVDEEGNVLGKTELAEGAAERLAGGPLLDLRILEGKKISKKGQIFDEEGEVIGELRDGELSDCAGKKVSEKGEVYDKEGKLVGHVNVVAGEAAENATRELLEELGELQPAEEGAEGEEQEEQQADTTDLPDLSVLEGLKVNKKGQILNEDGEPIGELVEGELADCTGKKVNDSGEVLDKDGNVIGRVQTLTPDTEEEQQPEVQESDENEEEQGEELPPLSILDGLTCNKSGKLIDANGNVVGELIEGDAKKLSKSGSTCDDQGQFWDNKGHVIGRAQTLPQEDAEEEAPFAGLEGLHVVDEGYVEDDAGNRVGIVVEGEWKKLLGRVVDEDGDVLDKKGSVIGHADRYEQPDEEAAPEVDLSFLQGKTVNKAGMVIGDEGVPVARLIEGKAKELAGKKLDDQGQLWNDRGQVIGRVELIPDEEREAKPEGPFAGLEGLRVIQGGKIADENENVVGELVEGNAKRLVGLSVDEDGDVMDRYGNVKGHAEPLPEEEEEQEVDNSLLASKSLNKQGYVVDENGTPFGRLVEGDAKELAGRRCDEKGFLYNDTGKVVGRCEIIPENERVARPEGPFAGLEGLRVVKEGWVEDEEGNRVGQLVEGNQKRLVGLAVDEDGDIIDKYGNVKGHAEPWDEPEEEKEDLSALNGCTVNKNGNAVDNSGAIIGRVIDGDVKSMVGKKVDGQGQIWDNAGNVVGQCELVHGQDTSPEGPFAGFEGLQIQKDGTVITPSGDIVGRIIEGDVKKLVGHTVDEDGDIVDKNGNSIGKAERWEAEEKERRVSPMSGHRVNKEGEVRDDNGDLIGKLTDGSLGHCVGQEIDDSGNVVDVDGNKIGECTLIENIVEEEYEGPSEEELEEARKRDEERKIAEKMGGICQQTLERVQPVCKQITEHMEKADRTPKEELDEEQLVNDVKPLIEEGGRILQECNGSLRGLDPDGKIAAQAKGRAGTGEATPEEYRLAETLKEITTTVVTTIDNAKKRLNDMPHAKKKLNPLWSLLTQPLFQILAAVGLLLTGVLGLVGQLLNALGLGGLVNGLLGGLGINKLLESFGLIDGGGDKKKKGGKSGITSGLSNLPVVGGLLGGK